MSKKKMGGLLKGRHGKNATKSDGRDRVFWRREIYNGDVRIKPEQSLSLLLARIT